MKYLVRELAPIARRKVNSWQNWKFAPPTRSLTSKLILWDIKDEYIVARKTKRSSTNSVPGSGVVKEVPVKWFNYRLGHDDVPVVVEDAGDTVKLSSRLVRLIASGSDFSVRYNHDRGNFSAFTTSAPLESGEYRCALSAFGGTAWEAIAALLYKCDLFASAPERFIVSGGGLGIG